MSGHVRRELALAICCVSMLIAGLDAVARMPREQAGVAAAVASTSRQL